LEEIYKKAEGIALQDIEGMKQYFGLNELEAWDYKFYRKKYEKALNNFDISSVKPYLEVEQVI